MIKFLEIVHVHQAFGDQTVHFPAVSIVQEVHVTKTTEVVTPVILDIGDQTVQIDVIPLAIIRGFFRRPHVIRQLVHVRVQTKNMVHHATSHAHLIVHPTVTA